MQMMKEYKSVQERPERTPQLLPGEQERGNPMRHRAIRKAIGIVQNPKLVVEADTMSYEQA